MTETSPPSGLARAPRPNARQRRRSRKLAFQALFMMDARREWDLRLARSFLLDNDPTPPPVVADYALRLVESFLAARAKVDAFVDGAHPRWRIGRMRAEDRAILRLGVTELWYHPDVPHKVAINEWLEIAKIFGGDDSPRFVNGLLDLALRSAEFSESRDPAAPR